MAFSTDSQELLFFHEKSDDDDLFQGENAVQSLIEPLEGIGLHFRKGLFRFFIGDVTVLLTDFGGPLCHRPSKQNKGFYDQTSAFDFCILLWK